MTLSARQLLRAFAGCGFLAIVCAVFLSARPAPLLHQVKQAAVMPAYRIHKAASVNKRDWYNSLQLGILGLSIKAYQDALQGHAVLQQKGRLQNDSIISIADLSLSSNKKRLFVIDIKNGRLLFHTFVSHGRNSGTALATHFSNEPNSFKTSLGFYVTGCTYTGQHGYSLRLVGEEAGINDKALSRGIVMHSAAYVNERLVSSQGYIGRSQGCPAVPEQLHKAIITAIRNGSCLYIYSPDQHYALRSSLLRGQVQG